MKKYENIVVYIKQKILSEQWEFNTLTPSENSLANRFNVHRLTARKALLQVKEDGWISSKKGQGYRVSKHSLNSENTNLDWVAVRISFKTKQTLFSEVEKNKFLEMLPTLDRKIFNSNLSFVKRIYDQDKKIYKIIKVIGNPRVVKKYDELALSKSIIGFYQHANIRVKSENVLVQNLYFSENIADEMKFNEKVLVPVVFEILFNLNNEIVHVAVIYTRPDRFLIEFDRKLV